MERHMESSSRIRQTLRGLAVAAVLVSCSTAFAQGFDPMSALATLKAAKASRLPPSAKYRPECHTKQVDLAWALLRYNVANNTRIDNLNSTVGKRLVVDSYLRSLFDDPGQGKGTFGNYKLVSGRITCAVHGPVAESRLPDDKVVQKILKNRCYKVQFNLATAMSRYNLRNNLKESKLTYELGCRMVKLGILPYLPDDPGSGPGTFRNFTHSSPFYPGITCIRHGRAPTP